MESESTARVTIDIPKRVNQLFKSHEHETSVLDKATDRHVIKNAAYRKDHFESEYEEYKQLQDFGVMIARNFA